MTALILGVEPIMDHLKEILVEHFPAKIAAMNEAMTDFVLPDIRDVYIGGGPARMEWPCGILKEEDPRDILVLSESALRGYPIAIGWFGTDDGHGPEQLSRQLWRYRNIAEEIISDHRNEPGYWLTTTDPQPIAEGPYPIEEEPTRYALVKGSRVWFQAFEQF